MNNPTIAPFGAWESPITAEAIVSDSVRLGQIAVDGRDVYWSELRPSEKGRSTIVKRDEAGFIEVLPAEFNARTRAHEYGGGAFCVSDGDIFFCNDADQRIYRVRIGETPVPLTPEGAYRYADLVVDREHDRLICVREDHTADGEPENTLVAVRFDGSVEVLAEGRDFYAAPRVSSGGPHIAWIQWQHPNMPWDETELVIAKVDESGAVIASEHVAGGDNVAIFQPEFAADGSLFYVSDATGWWNIYRYDGESDACVYSVDAEFGLPHWVFGMRTYDFNGPTRLAVTFQLDGISKLAEIDIGGGSVRTIPVPHIDMSGIRVADGVAYYIGGSMRAPSAVAGVDLESGTVSVSRWSQEVDIDPDSISLAQPVIFRTASEELAHGFFYPPANSQFEGPDDALPPLIVKSHGGPTGQTSCSYEPKIQFWTSRGFAVLDVNYRGSTGFGTRYRRLLNGKWGIADVEDCVAGAQMLVEQGMVDGDRMAITGGSAGGYTTLCALTFGDTFRAGASHYGIGDLEALARDTHKFESRYLDLLVGRWPEDRAVYQSRSPIQHTDQLSCPVIFFQGTEDKVVPPNQSEAMVEALREKNIPVAYVLFEGEGHGFRQAANVRQALENELSFYAQVFDFQAAGEIEPVEIENLSP